MTTVAAAPRRAARGPRGRDEVRAALLDAAADLFAARGPAAVSVRDVAARAGVNHGLVHRHFGSKEALVGTTLEQLAAAAAAPAPDARSADELGRLVGRTVDDRFWRVLAWSLLEGREPAGLQAHFPVLDELVRLVGREHH
ncbi:MAG TPA: helix-turn-helix domain-containing protein, partial [Acidimicrobiia bacterium]